MRPVPVSANEPEIARASASPDRGARELRGNSPRVTEEDPVARVRQELALWVSPRMKDVRDAITAAALIDLPVLITGETGTGKGVVARAVHYLGGRRHAPFVRVHCAAVPRELLETELFGHEPEAFTGADSLAMGKFETADGGTIFLDEIGDLHPDLQAKLLHVFEDGQFSRVDGRSSLKVDVRVVAATTQDLKTPVTAERFHDDLFYRLNVIRIVVPPLRERPEDIPQLTNYFLQRYSRLFQREGFTLPPDTLERLQRHTFPGNVHELESLVQRITVLRDLDLTQAPLIGTTARDGAERAAKRATPAPGSLRTLSQKAAQAAERRAIEKALERTQWNRLRAAKLLNISYRSLLYKIKAAGLAARRKAPDLP